LKEGSTLSRLSKILSFRLHRVHAQSAQVLWMVLNYTMRLSWLLLSNRVETSGGTDANAAFHPGVQRNASPTSRHYQRTMTTVAWTCSNPRSLSFIPIRWICGELTHTAMLLTRHACGWQMR
jgi:hypothetical protein